MDNKEIGRFIAMRRKEKKMTQKELAKKLGVTNKAVSKWETGAGLPDVSIFPRLCEELGTTVDEMMQAGEKTYDFDSGEEKPLDMPEKKRKRNLWGTFLFVVLAGLAAFLQAGWFFLGRQREYEYLWDGMFYAVNGLLLILILGAVLCFCGTKKKAGRAAAVLIGILFLGNLGAGFRADIRKSIVNLSPDFQHMLVLKYDTKTGKTYYYRNRFVLFAKPKEEFPYTVGQEIKKQWLADDVCAVTYSSPDDGKVHQFIGTYGDRGDGITTPYVTSLIDGRWRAGGEESAGWQLVRTLEGLQISNAGGVLETYAFEDCVQFGSLAVALCKNGIPIWTVALADDSQIGENDLLTKDSRIILCRVSMDQTAPMEMVRAGY